MDFLVRIEANIDALRAELNNAGGQLDRLGQRANSSGGMIKNALSFAGGLGITNIISGIADKFVDAAKSGWEFNSSMEQNLASFKTLLGGSDVEAKKMVDTLTKMAAITPFETTDLTKAASTLMGFGVEANKVQGTLQMLGDASMGNRDRFNSLTLAFAQVQAAGKLTGQDLLQMVNAGMNPLQQMAKDSGKSLGQLKGEMEKGAISAKMVEDAFKGATSEGGLFYKSMEAQSKTFDGQMSTLRDNFKLTFGQIMKPLFDNISTNILPKFIDKLTVFQTTFSKTNSVVSAFGAVFNVSEKNMESFSDSMRKAYREALKPFVDIVIDIYNKYMPVFIETFKNIYSQVMPAFERVFKVITEKIIPDFKEGINSFVKLVFPIFKDAMQFITEKLLPPLIKVFEFVYTQILPKFYSMFKTVMPYIGQIMAALWDVIKPVLTYIVDAFTESWPEIKLAVIDAVDKIVFLIENLVRVIAGLSKIVGGVFANDWRKIWDGMVQISTQGAKKVAVAMTGTLSSLNQGLKTSAGNMLGGLVTVVDETTKKVKEAETNTKGSMSTLNSAASDGATKAVSKTKETIDNILKAAEESAKKLRDLTISNFDKLGEATITALKNKWSAEEKMQLDSLTRQGEALRTQTDYNIAQYDRELLAKLKVIDEGASKEIETLQNKITNMNNITKGEEDQKKEIDFNTKLTELKGINEIDPVKKIALQKQIDDLVAAHNREFQLSQRAMQQESLKNEIDLIRNNAIQKKAQMTKEAEERKQALLNEQTMMIEGINNMSVTVKTKFENLLKEENLQATARTLALDKNNKDLIDLLTTYNPKWQDAGQSFGQRMLDGINSTKASIQATIAEIMGMVGQANAAQNQVIMQAKAMWNQGNAAGNTSMMNQAHSIAESARAAGGTIPAYANGTNFAAGGWSLVGERGPEILNLPRGSSVTPNDKMGGNVYVTVGTLVGSNGMNELANVLSRQLNKKYASAIGGGAY